MSFFSFVNLRYRFTIFLAATSLTLLILFSLVVYQQARQKSYSFAQQSLSALLEHEWEHLDFPTHQGQLKQNTPHFKDVYLRVLENENVVYDSFAKDLTQVFPPTGVPAENKLFGRFTREKNGRQFELQGYYDLTPVNAYLRVLRNILLVSCLLAALILVPLSLLSTRFLLKPFRLLANETSKVNAEQLTYRFQEVSTQDEFGVLTHNFNELLDRLEKSFQHIKRFALNASHELRTPLAVIISQGEMALRKERSAAECRIALEKMLAPAKRLREIINRLLFLAELDRLGQEKRAVAITVESTIHSLVSTIQDAHAGPPKKILINSAKETTFIGNREIFEIVLSNLIENAYKFAKENISIDYWMENGGLLVSIDDDGPGIDVELHSIILEPLGRTQLPLNVRAEKRGSGLGLSIVKACLDSIKGKVLLSVSKLGGLSVSVSFPNG